MNAHIIGQIFVFAVLAALLICIIVGIVHAARFIRDDGPEMGA